MAVTRSIISTLLGLEEVAVAITGNKRRLQLLMLTRHENEDAEPLFSFDNRAPARPPSLLSTLGEKRLWRLLFSLGLFCAVVIVEAGYPICHVLFGASEEALVSIVFIDLLAIPVVLSFYFFAPVHAALGYFDAEKSREDCEKHKQMLLEDKGANRIAMFVLFALLVSTASDGVLAMMGDVPGKMIPYYVFSALVNIGTVYASLLLGIICFRSILVRLHKEVYEEVKTELKKKDGYCSTKDNKDVLVARWLGVYKALREDMEHLEDFGVVLLLGLFLFILEVANIIATAWKDQSDEWGRVQAVSIILAYAMHASVLSMAFYTIGYLITECTENIGPKLSMLAVATSMGSSSSSDRSMGMLARTFLLAPISLYIGNFEVSPEISNAVGTIFVGLFVATLGFHLPEL